MKKILLGALLSVELAVATFVSAPVSAPAQQATYNGPYITTVTGNGDIGPFPTYGQSVCGFTLHSGSGTLTMGVYQSVDGQTFSQIGSNLTGLTKETQYTWAVLPSPPPSQTLTSGQAGVTADKLTISSFTGTPMRVFFGCTSSPLAVNGSGGGGVASVASAGAPIFVGGTATNPTVGLTTPLTVPFGGTGVASPNPAITATPCGASPGVSGTWPNVTYTVPACGGNSPTFTGQVAAAGFGANAANAWSGSCTGSSSAATCTAIIGTTFTTPICLAGDTSQAASAIDVVCSVSGTTVTVQTVTKTLTGSCSMSTTSTCTGSIAYKLISSACLTQPTVASITVSASCANATSTTTVTANVNNSLTWTFLVSGIPEVTHVYNFVVFGNPS